MKKHLTILIITFFIISCQDRSGEYVCPPCDLPCDTLTFQKAGVCPHCNMKLVKKSELIDETALVLNEVNLESGSGVFLIEGGKGKEEKTIKVYYHKPEKFSSESKILMVIPGAGRNGDSYRNAWNEESEKYNILVLSPMYEEAQYPFEEYHLCGLIKEPNLRESVKYKEGTNEVYLDEEAFTYKNNANRHDWIFNDFDRIFNIVVESTKSTESKYDVFGHSAGGQILHRMALFSGEMKANRIIASNSGFYTLPDLDTKMPFGMKSFYSDQRELTNSFSKELILLIGELDNENEQGGTLLRSKTVDKQGRHRLERARHFYKFSKKKAEQLKTEFKWEIQIVPNVGHDHKLMGDAAAIILYE